MSGESVSLPVSGVICQCHVKLLVSHLSVSCIFVSARWVCQCQSPCARCNVSVMLNCWCHICLCHACLSVPGGSVSLPVPGVMSVSC